MKNRKHNLYIFQINAATFSYQAMILPPLYSDVDIEKTGLMQHQVSNHVDLSKKWQISRLFE